MKRTFLFLISIFFMVSLSFAQAPIQFIPVSSDGNLNSAPLLISEVHLRPTGATSSIAIYDAVDATGSISTALLWSASGPHTLDGLTRVFDFSTYILAATGPYIDLTSATALLGITRADDRLYVRYNGTPNIDILDDRGILTFYTGRQDYLTPRVALPLLADVDTWSLVGPAQTPTTVPTATPTSTPTATATATATNVAASAAIAASTNDGLAPLAVTFILGATDTDGFVANYALYSASGVLIHQYNYYDAILAYSEDFTYTVPGDYVADLTVLDSAGASTSATVAIAVSTYTPTDTPTSTPTLTPTPTYALPVVALASDPSPATGDAPLTMAFVGSATGVDGDLATFNWYFEFPALGATGSLSSATTIQSATHVYSADSYTVKFEVVDENAQVSSATAAVTSN